MMLWRKTTMMTARSFAVSSGYSSCSGALVPVNSHSNANPNPSSRSHETLALVHHLFKSVSASSNHALTLKQSLSLFNRLLQSQPSSIHPFNQLFSVLYRIGCLSHVVGLYRRLLNSDLDISPNKASLSVLMDSLCRLCRLDLGLSVLSKFFKLGLQPSAATFNILINGMIDDGILTPALAPQAVRLFRRSGHRPNLVTYNILIKGFCLTGHLHTAVHLLRKMELDSVNAGTCKPDIVTYSTIIHYLGKSGQQRWALDLFWQMISMGISPNRVTYTALIRGACGLGLWDQVTRLFDEMKGNNLSPCVYTYSVLVRSFCERGMISAAHSVVAIMIRSNVEPNVVTYNMLLEAYCKRSELDKAMKLFRGMACAPNVISYTSLIKHHGKVGRMHEGKALFQEMMDRGLVPDIRSYVTLIGALFECGHTKAACDLSRQLDDYVGVTPYPDIQVHGLVLGR